MNTRLKIAVIGDVHRAWTPADNQYFDASDYDAVLCVGDLPGLNHHKAVEVARQIAALEKPVFLIPGNHDGVPLRLMLAEISGSPLLTKIAGGDQLKRVEALRAGLDGATMCGYSHHVLSDTVGLIAARPHAMGQRFTFAPYLEQAFGVHSMEESSARLCELVDQSPCPRLIFMGHNGPTGLGAKPTDIWGCDFKRGGGDWGDPDLRAAIDHARASGREVLAVVAGHMHRMTKQGKARTWHVTQDHVHYVNAAQVPQIFKRNGERIRHHVLLTIDAAGCTVEDMFIPDDLKRNF